MLNRTGRLCRWTAFYSLIIVTVGISAAIVPSHAAQRPGNVGPEVQQEGLTVAEQHARQQQLNRELTALLPAGVDGTPLQVEITEADKSDLLLQEPRGIAPLRIGVVKPLVNAVGKPSGGQFNFGLTRNSPDGSFVWAMTVVSPGAQAIRLHITGCSLPDNAELYFMSPNGQAHGPYTGVGRNGDGDFWTHSVASETGRLVLVYTGNLSEADRSRMSFLISEVAHISGRPPRSLEQSHDNWPCSDNAPCLVDVTCEDTGPAAPAEDAVAKMEWIQMPFIYTCTGGLLADTDTSSQIPYFLTANHCLSSNSSNLETFFNYTTDTCEGSCPDSLVTGGTPPPASTVGVTVVATGTKGDYTLLTLNEAPPAGAVYLGWNNSPVAGTDGEPLYRVSNPNFGPQAYSVHEVDTASPTCTGWPRGERIYSIDQVGATMGGSSGSPVLNSSGEVVGQLSGCCGYNCADVCDAANNWTVDGALAFYWDKVAAFLDPQSGTPLCNNDGSCGAGEDCSNCPNDCREKTNGSLNSRYCCDGDLAGCGDSRCSENGWSCGGDSSGCTSDAECNDGLFCNGAETCSGGVCQSGTDPCPGQGCDEDIDMCTSVSCAGNRESCSQNSDCCSGNCRGGVCRGN